MNLQARIGHIVLHEAATPETFRRGAFTEPELHKSCKVMPNPRNTSVSEVAGRFEASLGFGLGGIVPSPLCDVTAVRSRPF